MNKQAICYKPAKIYQPRNMYLEEHIAPLSRIETEL